MTGLRSYQGAAPMAGPALEMMILTASRSGEVRGMLWSEIDFDAAVWTIPPERMKRGREHQVPLSGAALAILKRLEPGRINQFVFPGRGNARPVGHWALWNLVQTYTGREEGAPSEASPHGFRSSFRSWARAKRMPDDIAERCLAHQRKDATLAAYDREEMLEDRRVWMEKWSEFLSDADFERRALEAGRGVIPVEVTQTPWHYTNFWDWLDHWQTLIAGFLAFAAGFGTIVAAIWAIRATRSTAREQIVASRADTDSMIAATRAQTEATFKQTETTIRLEELRKASEALSFHGMLAAAMTRVITEATWARKTYPQFFPARPDRASAEAFAVRQCITKGAFAELRAACVRLGGPLTAELLELEREIDSFAGQCEDYSPPQGGTIRMGKHAGLGEQLGQIETKAAALSERAIEALE